MSRKRQGNESEMLTGRRMVACVDSPMCQWMSAYWQHAAQRRIARRHWHFLYERQPSGAGAISGAATKVGSTFSNGISMSIHVPVFFYGGLINERMLARLGIDARAREVAALDGYQLTIAPWMNVEPSDDGRSFGVVMQMTHSELARIYSQLKVEYAPIPVTADVSGRPVAALCYVVAQPYAVSQADAPYVETLLEAADELGFPAWYLERIRSYLPPTSA